MTDFEDDVRAMLHRRAADAAPSPDAWEQIQERLRADERPAAVVRRRPFQVLAGGAAAAAVAALVVGQLVSGPTSQVATEPPVTEAPAAPAFPVVFAEPGATPAEAAAAYLEARTGVAPSEGQVVMQDAEAAEIVFHDGPVFSDVLLRLGPGGWYVDSSTSDLMQLYPSYTGTEIGGDITIEAGGSLRVSYRSGDGDPVVEEEPAAVERLEMLVLEQAMPGEPYVVIEAVLAMDDGTFVVAEGWVLHPEEGGTGGDALDGDRSGWLRARSDEGFVEIDPAAMLSGDEAVAAAREDGQLPPDGTLPNDFYIDDDEASTRSYPVSDRLVVELFDCSAGCELRTVPTDDFLAGRVQPFGGDNALVMLTIRDGAVVHIREIYVP